MNLDLKSVHKPLKEKYRSEPGSSRITLGAKASQEDTLISCSVDIGRAIHQAEAHAGVGGTGAAACSGDLLLGALAACTQLPANWVAEAMRIETERVQVKVEGEMDLAGTLGISKEASVGFESIRTTFEVKTPGVTGEELENRRRKTQQYCVVFQTLVRPPRLETEWA